MDVGVSFLPVLAQGAGVPGGDPSGALLKPLLIMGAVFAIFYVLIIRPQQKQDRQRREMLEAIRRKDRVMTSGGILGEVTSIDGDRVTVRISKNPDVRVEIARSAVVEVVDRDGADTDRARSD